MLDADRLAARRRPAAHEVIERDVAAGDGADRLDDRDRVQLRAQVAHREVEVVRDLADPTGVDDRGRGVGPAMEHPLGRQRGEEALHLLERAAVVTHRVGAGDVQRRVALGQQLPGVVEEPARIGQREVVDVAVAEPDRAPHQRVGDVVGDVERGQARAQGRRRIVAERDGLLDAGRHREALLAIEHAVEVEGRDQRRRQLVEAGGRGDDVAGAAAEHRQHVGGGRGRWRQHAPALVGAIEDPGQLGAHRRRRALIDLDVDRVVVERGEDVERVTVTVAGELEDVIVVVELAAGRRQRTVDREAPALEIERRR